MPNDNVRTTDATGRANNSTTSASNGSLRANELDNEATKAAARANEATREVSKADPDLERVVEKIDAAESILVALSKDPTVDEMAAAIGLTLALDKMGKHATAIYSGKTPNVLKFLEPEKTFEANTNSLQDFIIALNKEKADHLRYKIEGDFVKVYITPYRTTIDKNDLEFSHGEVNVDLIISLNVNEAEDLDAALTKHGRIMHDASTVNISSARPGKLGGIEWNRASASSVSEMVTRLIEEMDQPITEDVATALLTGVEAATERFSNDKTTSETMAIAAQLMQAGANQQLIVANIMRPEKKAEEAEEAMKPKEPEPGSVEVDVDDEDNSAAEGGELEIKRYEDNKIENGSGLSPEQQLEQMMNSSIPEPGEKKTAVEALAEAVPELPAEPKPEPPAEPAPVMTTIGMPTTGMPMEMTAPTTSNITTGANSEEDMKNKLISSVPTVEVPPVYNNPADSTVLRNGIVMPSNEAVPKDYGAMMEEELKEPDLNTMVNQMVAQAQNPVETMQPTQPVQPTEPTQPEVSAQPMESTQSMEPAQTITPAQTEAPMQSAEPMQTPQSVELPPPPVPTAEGMMPPEMASLPPVQPTQPAPNTVGISQPMEQLAGQVPEVPNQDESAAEGIPTAPAGVQQVAPTEPVNPVVVQPEIKQQDEGGMDSSSQSQPVQDPTLVPPVQDPGAFKIPGM